jgi:DNA-binding CsgD family transcriptional regulator
MPLVFGLFFSLAVKRRNLWATLSSALSLFVFYLAFEIMHRYRSSYLPSVLFYGSGFIIAIAGVFLFLYLASLPKESPPVTGDTAQPEKRMPVGNALRWVFLFPLLAALIIFWTNSFTQRLFLPTVQLSAGLNFPTVIMIVMLPLFGILADLDFRRFIKIFIPISFVAFLLSPSLLLFTRLETAFYILYTFNAVTILLMTMFFPFVILDLYWKNGRGGLAWLLAISVHLIRVYAITQFAPFMSVQVNNAYAVTLLTLSVIVFFIFAQKSAKLLQADVLASHDASTAEQPTDCSVEESFRVHELSKRETELAGLILKGMTNQEIAAQLHVEVDTVKKHTKSIFIKYKVKRRPEFMAKVLTNSR